MINTIKLNFGKYTGTLLQNVPEDYLKWCIDNNIIKGRALSYSKALFNYPKDKYQVRIKDSINAEGDYIIKAYSNSHAIHICQKDNRIKNTQSSYGTTYTAIKL